MYDLVIQHYFTKKEQRIQKLNGQKPATAFLKIQMQDLKI